MSNNMYMVNGKRLAFFIWNLSFVDEGAKLYNQERLILRKKVGGDTNEQKRRKVSFYYMGSILISNLR